MRDETVKSQAAFLHYAALGPERSIAKLADALGKRAGYTRTLETWSSKYNWVQRAKEYDAAILTREAERKEQQRREAIEKMNERHALIGTTQQARAIEQIKKLMDAQAFGSIAAVQLLKLAIETERIARNLPDKKVEITGKDGGAIAFVTEWGSGAIEESDEYSGKEQA